ncbi:hypothetical protein [Poseidonocella sp. HB161398]|uniref:hypothetical protein n=1 Tax=Poseidonocella sp. HB161398 TaxID=2320855 RepID=UPI001107DF68|nr:hypothetical protein [Poseidonocella sp. HB161398]
MRQHLAKIRSIWLSVVIVLAACTVTLAPPYDAELASGLDSTNQTTLILFSALSQGASADEFSRFQGQYDAAIGQFDALRIRADARETPPLSRKAIENIQLFPEFCGMDDGCVNPTPGILETLLSTLRQMRNTHRSRGLPADKVALFKNDYEIAITQALNVEQSFNR